MDGVRKGQDYDVIVIGSGPGGEGAAMQVAKAGQQVAVIDEYPRVGGNCTHYGTIPSKALRQAIQRLTQFRGDPLYRAACREAQLSYPDLLNTAKRVIDSQVNLRTGFYDRNAVDVIQGRAAFVDANTVDVTDATGQAERHCADKFVVATGCRPYHPPDVDFAHPRIHDSNSILELDWTPRSLTIFGAGVIGCEYASIFRNLGMKLDLINTRSRLLEFLDDEITDALSYHLREQGVRIRHNEWFDCIEADDSGVTLHLESGKKIRSDCLLWANGRTGNSQDMGLEAIGLEIDGRGRIGINGDYQTAAPHIYAVGDVIGYPSLASASYDQGRFAAQHLLTGRSETHLIQNIPTGIYTSPEISSLGPTESELTEQKVPYEVGHSQFRSLARAQIIGCPVGMLKILFHRESLKILGIHCFGPGAAEIVHIGQAIMCQEGEANTLMYFINTTFNYPTMAEAYRVAALNGLNRTL
jgi:NAD(P) transhydrogenase